MFSSLVTATKNRYASLRGGDEADGDTEDDSHISRVLRNYYLEQNRTFPPWLGGGPQLGQQQQQLNRPGAPGQGGVNLRRGQQPSPVGGVKATLSDIWDQPPPPSPGLPNQQQQQQQQHQQHQSQNSTSGMNKMRFFRRPQDPPPQAAPHINEPEANHAAQSSIRDRLWSNRGGTPPQPQGRASPMSHGSGSSSGGGGGGGAGGQPQYQAYQGGRDRSPGPGRGSSPGHQYQSSGNSGYGRSSGGGREPAMSATMTGPWQDDFGYGGGGDGNYGSQAGSSGSGSSGYRRAPPGGGGRMGLPTGPKMMRQQPDYR